MKLRQDETGNYLVDENGNDVACIYEMAVVEKILGARAKALQDADSACFECFESDPGDQREKSINEGVQRCRDAIEALMRIS